MEFKKQQLVGVFTIVTLMLSSCCTKDVSRYYEDVELTEQELNIIPYEQGDTIKFIDSNNNEFYLYCSYRDYIADKHVDELEDNCNSTETIIRKKLKCELQSNIQHYTCLTPVKLIMELKSCQSSCSKEFDIQFRSEDETCVIKGDFNNTNYYTQSFTSNLDVSKNYFPEWEYLNSKEINGVVYSNVYFQNFTKDNSDSLDNFIDTIYYTKEEGIIKLSTFQQTDYYKLK